MTQHTKSTKHNVATGETEVVYFTDEEWAAHEQARLEAEAVEAARDHDGEEIDRQGRIFIAFLKAYANREGLTFAQVRNAIKAQL